MSVSMYFPEMRGSSKWRLLFSEDFFFFFFWVGFRATDAGLLSESESFESLPPIAKKIWNSNSGRGGEMEKERERGSSEGSVAVRGEEGGQETDDQACLPVLFSSPLPPAPKAPLLCLLSSLFLTLAPPRSPSLPLALHSGFPVWGYCCLS